MDKTRSWTKAVFGINFMKTWPLDVISNLPLIMGHLSLPYWNQNLDVYLLPVNAYTVC